MPVPSMLLELPQDPTLNKYNKATRYYSSSFLAEERTAQAKCFRPYEVPGPSVGTYDAKDPAVEEGPGASTSTVPFRSRTQYRAANPAISTIGMYPDRTKCNINVMQVTDWENDNYKRRGEVESYQPRLSQNLSQADLVGKRLEDDNFASLSFAKSKSNPVLGLKEINNPTSIGPGEFWNPNDTSVKVIDAGKKSWYFRSQGTRDRVDVNVAVARYLERKKRELEGGDGVGRRPRTATAATESTDETVGAPSGKLRSYTMDVRDAFKGESRLRVGTAFASSRRSLMEMTEEGGQGSQQRPSTTMGACMSPHVSHSVDFNGFHSVKRNYKDRTGKVRSKMVRKRGPTSVVGRDDNFDAYSLGFGRGQIVEPNMCSYNPKSLSSKRVMGMTHVFKGTERFKKEKKKAVVEDSFAEDSLSSSILQRATSGKGKVVVGDLAEGSLTSSITEHAVSVEETVEQEEGKDEGKDSETELPGIGARKIADGRGVSMFNGVQLQTGARKRADARGVSMFNGVQLII